MGKNEFLTPKAIANRIKAKGLQKLRWYCQMCQKQCRDENGFKCHCLSESHQRQMLLFGHNPHRIVEGFSDEFEQGFMDLIKRAHRFSRIAATVVYNEYINDRHHVHMNSTRWATLTEFVKHLGKAGLCKVEDTPKGWFITYIDRDSETLFKDRLKSKRLKADLVDEERQEKAIQAQIARAQEKSGISEPGFGQNPDLENPDLENRDLENRDLENRNLGENRELEGKEKRELEGKEKGKVVFLLQNGNGGKSGGSKLGFGEEKGGKSGGIELGFGEEVELGFSGKKKGGEKEKGSVLDELMKEEEKKKEKVNRKEYWLCEGIIVKVMSKSLASKGYYKQKGIVKKVIDKYTGEIEMLETKHKLRVDQAELETVIPQIGGIVKIVNGAYRGQIARLLDVDVNRFCARVEIEKGVYDGRVLKAVDYEDICKIA